MVCCGIWAKFDKGNNLVKEYKYWTLLLNLKPRKFGQCVAILKRHIDKLADVTPEEMSEYALVASEIESALRTSFDTHLVHHLLLMSLDKHVHFHIMPRYKKPINFGSISWTDDGLPSPLAADPASYKSIALSKDDTNALISKLKSAMH